MEYKAHFTGKGDTALYIEGQSDDPELGPDVYVGLGHSGDSFTPAQARIIAAAMIAAADAADDAVKQ